MIKIRNNKNLVDIYDPFMYDEEKIKNLKFRLLKSPFNQKYKYDILIVLTAHNNFIIIKSKLDKYS